MAAEADGHGGDAGGGGLGVFGQRGLVAEAVVPVGWHGLEL